MRPHIKTLRSQFKTVALVRPLHREAYPFVTLREKSGVIPHMSRISQFLTVFKQTKLSIVVDDLSSSRAALVAPAQDITPEHVNRILTISGGLTFVALSPERAAAFLLSTMTRPSSFTPLPLPVSQMAQYVSV